MKKSPVFIQVDHLPNEWMQVRIGGTSLALGQNPRNILRDIDAVAFPGRHTNSDPITVFKPSQLF